MLAATLLGLYLVFAPLQLYRCVHLHAMYSDMVEYGIVVSHSHTHPQSLAEELLVGNKDLMTVVVTT